MRWILSGMRQKHIFLKKKIKTICELEGFMKFLANKLYVKFY